MTSSNNKYCAVPQCSNSSGKTPEKLFFFVPMDPYKRKKWMTVIQRVDSPLGPKTVAYCCEDHFDVENDMENYIKHKLVGGKTFLKKGVVPHKFAWQSQPTDEDAKEIEETKAEKKKELIEQIMNEYMATNCVEKIFVAETIEVDDPLQDANTNDKLNGTGKKPAMIDKQIQVNIKKKVRSKSTCTETDKITRSYTKGAKKRRK